MPTSPRRTPGPENVEQVLNDLANMQIVDRPILGDKKNIASAIKQAKALGQKRVLGQGKVNVSASLDRIDLTGNSESGRSDDQNHPATPIRLPKAAQLRRLSKTAEEVTDNVALAGVVRDFLGVLRTSRSKTLTKEGFAVLDAVYKQLADPSVYVVPLRTSQTRRTAEPPAVINKLDVLAKLRRSVQAASSNADLASMVKDFGSIIDKSNGRTVTKDAFAFLEGLATRLTNA